MNNTDFGLVAATAATIVCWVAYFLGMYAVSNTFSAAAIWLGLYIFYKLIRGDAS